MSAGAPAGWQGALALTGHASVTASGDASAEVRGSGDHLQLGALSLDRAEIEARYGPALSDAAARLTLLGGRSSLRVAIDRPGHIVGEARAESLSLEPAARLASGTGVSGLAGRLSADLSFAGPAAGPWTLDGHWNARGSHPRLPEWAAEGTTA